MAPKRQLTPRYASSPVNSKKTRLSASQPRAMRNVIELMIPPPISQEMIDRADKMIVSISDHDKRQDSVATSTRDKDNAKDDSSKTITPLRNHHKFVCISIDDSEDESDRMLPAATDRQEVTDNLAETLLPPAIHHEFVCITIDDSEDELDQERSSTTHRHAPICTSSDNDTENRLDDVAPLSPHRHDSVCASSDDLVSALNETNVENRSDETPSSMRNHHDFVRITLSDDDKDEVKLPGTPPPPYSLFP